jgi:hypothetical protein
VSPTSDAVERLAQQHAVPVLEAVEFYLERAAIREYEGRMTRDDAEAGALEDTRMWVKLWLYMKGEVGPQMTLKGKP